ncbi:MAG: methyltransferase domain-containing protein [Candidatus Eremiobacteraeota bacterium]|nr:methyltransferase domain-containing protein [Candidatus Eremiobacteraeota bacterium]
MSSMEGFAASDPIPFTQLAVPGVELLNSFDEYGMSAFDVQHVTRPLLGMLADESPFKLVRYADGVSYDWAYRLALSVMPKGGLVVGQLNGSPAMFADGLSCEDSEQIYQQIKHLYDNWRNTPRLTNDIQPGAKTNIEARAKDFVKRLKQPARVLDLGSVGAGPTQYMFEGGFQGSYLKIDSDTISLAVLGDIARKYPGVKFVGVCESLEKLDKKSFKVRVEQRLGGKATALVCTHVLHQLGLTKMPLEVWLSHFEQLLEPGAQVLLADFYYPENVSDDEIERSRRILMQRVEDHPELNSSDYYFGGRDEYVDPDEVQEILECSGFEDFKRWSTPSLEGVQEEFYVLEARRKG